MHNPSFTLESHETEELLGRLAEWRLGICSNGTLASEACFVLDRMPSIVIIPKSTKPLTTFINTTSKWTFNLVQIGVISNNSDDALLQTLADSYMIFKSLFQNRAGSFNTAHAIRLEEYSTISIDNILRPTDGMKKSIEGVLSESNEEVRWSRLMGFWDNFGYYWPRKLILGFREHCSKPYACKDQTTNTNTYQSTHLVLKEKMNRIQPRKDPYDLHDFIKNAVIAARQDLTPLHELFDANHREQIKEMIQQRFTQIPVGHHLKIYNSANDCYLAWSPRHSEDKYGDNFAIRPLTRDNLTAKSDKQYLWQLEWTTTVIEQQINIADHTSPTVRGGSCVYIHPSCRTKLRRQNITDSSSTVEVDTHKMMLVCQPPESYNSNDHMSTIRPLRLKRYDELLNDMKWLIEYPTSELRQSNSILDIDQHIHKLKPLVQGDIIQLKQIGFLTAFDTDRQKVTEESYIQSLRRVRRIPQLDGSKLKSRKALMCVDEQDTIYGHINNAHWRIELATADDLVRHRNGLVQDDYQSTFESSTDHESEMHYLESPAPTFSINREDSDDRARFFENLAKTSASQLLYGFVKKVTLDPLAHIVLPSKTKADKK